MSVLPKFTKTEYYHLYPAVDPKNPALSAAGKVIVVTGGGIGIGAEITRAFATAGATKLAILGRTESALLETKSSIESEYPSAEIFTAIADIVDATAVEAAFKAVVDKWGKINVLVHSAGYLSTPASTATANVEEYWKGFEINIKGTLNVLQAFIPQAVSDAVVVNLNTAVAHAPYFPGASAYGASKIANGKMFEYLQYEHPEFTVVNIHPGLVATRMQVKSGMEFPKEFMTDAALSGGVSVWIASGAAKFLGGRLIWVNWDVNELKVREKEIKDGNKLTFGLTGWPV